MVHHLVFLFNDEHRFEVKVDEKQLPFLLDQVKDLIEKGIFADNPAAAIQNNIPYVWFYSFKPLTENY